MTAVNRQLILTSRPGAEICNENFSFVSAFVSEPGEGEFVVRNEWFSLDPAMRGWVSGARSYIAPVEIGTVMRAFAAGRVVASRHSRFPVGTAVTGLFGLQDYAVSAGDRNVRPVPSGVPLSACLGVLGLTGLTAYFGLLDIGRPKAGQTVVVSAAAGAVGSVACQIARLKGCRVVGIAGGPEKCDWVKSLGADAVIDYKNESLRDRIKATCPDGIDVYFDNVGGNILEEVLRRINVGARIVLCGGISQYNTSTARGPANFLSLLANRARMEGFVYFDYQDRFDEGEHALRNWLLEGQLQHQEDIVTGLENSVDGLAKLFDGSNRGKLLVRNTKFLDA